MSIVRPDIYSYLSPDPIFPYGEAVLTGGLENRGAINGYGAVTRGFLWQLYDIWTDVQYYSSITTTWSVAAGSSIATTWQAAAGASISTTWNSVRFGVWGDYTS